MVADPCGEGDESGRKPVLGRTQHQLLTRRSNGLLPYESKIIRLQYTFRRTANDRIMSVFLLEFLPQLYKTCLRQLCTGREAVRIHKGVEVRCQLLKIRTQIIDIPANSDNVGIRCIDVVAQFPQTACDVRQIRLRDHSIAHRIPFFLS
jgi:hypothetical protein